MAPAQQCLHPDRVAVRQVQHELVREVEFAALDDTGQLPFQRGPARQRGLHRLVVPLGPPAAGLPGTSEGQVGAAQHVVHTVHAGQSGQPDAHRQVHGRARRAVRLAQRGQQPVRERVGEHRTARCQHRELGATHTLDDFGARQLFAVSFR